MNASSLFLRSIRRTHGLSQGVVAKRAQTSAPALSHIENGRREPSAATLDKLLLATGNRLGVVPTRRAGSLEAGAAIHDELAIGDVQSAFRSFIQFSDNLAAEDGVTRVVLAANEPEPTGSVLWDAALAAVSEYWLRRDGLPIPKWVESPNRAVPQRTILSSSAYTRTIRDENVPAEFSRRNIALDKSVLASV
ncbi:XRE family transcriptional regulator [Cryobacterium glaciale]|uniref:XRE family transcriptional regulator n=1 Tax=Cryobacterium glaciale TaxID=1259145 RepID=A0A4R8UY39_9MICO|nr:XRE family transcriptional regulator [Cryobacterium glaciale]